MNKLNTETYQIPKISTYEGRRQDHGTVGIEDALRIRRDKREDRREESERRDRKIARQVLREGMDEYLESLSTSELEDAANKILGEKPISEYTSEAHEEPDDNDETDLDRAHRHTYEDAQKKQEQLDGMGDINVFELSAALADSNKYKAQDATLDPEFAEDDRSDIVAGFNIKNRP